MEHTPVEPRPSKSRDGIPTPLSPRGVHMAVEARRSRCHLYPTTFAYGAGGIGLVLWSLPLASPWTTAFIGIAVFSALEYCVHRGLLHGRFPNGPGPLRRFLHRRLDHLHYVHHLKPWDGAHMHGGLNDTLPLVLPLAVVAAAMGGIGAALVGIVVLAYVGEEWVHHALHYGRSRWPPFPFLRRRHFLHHGPRGAERDFGLTSGLWDVVCGTTRPRRHEPSRNRSAASSSRSRSGGNVWPMPG